MCSCFWLGTWDNYCACYLAYKLQALIFNIKFGCICSKIVGGRDAVPDPAGGVWTLPQTLQSQSSGFALEPRAVRALETNGGGGDSTTSCLRAPDMKLRHCAVVNTRQNSTRMQACTHISWWPSIGLGDHQGTPDAPTNSSQATHGKLSDSHWLTYLLSYSLTYLWNTHLSRRR